MVPYQWIAILTNYYVVHMISDCLHIKNGQGIWNIRFADVDNQI